MNILTWILWGCLLAILAPIVGISWVYLFTRMVLGKDPGTLTYDDIMEAQREKREALIEDEDRPSMLPTDGSKITPQMLDSKSDLKDLIDGSEIFRRKKETGA
jgi:hypothetical protein